MWVGEKLATSTADLVAKMPAPTRQRLVLTGSDLTISTLMAAAGDPDYLVTADPGALARMAKNRAFVERCAGISSVKDYLWNL